MNRIRLSIVAAMLAGCASVYGAVEPIQYGNFNSWVTRQMKESGLIGGNQKTVYAIVTS